MKKSINMFIDFSGMDSFIAGEKVLTYLEKNSLPISSLSFYSYQAYPGKDNYNKNFLLNQSRLYKWSVPYTREKYQAFIVQGKEMGFSISLKKIIDVNSRNAHMGFQFAKLHRKEHGYFRLAMSAIFIEGINLSLQEEIVRILKKLGLNKNEYLGYLDTYDQLITEDILYAARLGINEAPAFIKNEVISSIGVPDQEELENLFASS